MPTTTHYLFFFFSLLLSKPSTVLTLTAPGDVAALAAIKAAIHPSSIPPWSCLATWDFSSSPAADPCLTPRRTHFVCGVTCSSAADGTSRITDLTLDPAGYAGVLSPAISNLTSLAHLDLSGNYFRGPIPASISSLAAIRTLALASNAFSGDLPSSIGKLAALESLDLSRNVLTGAIPKALASLAGLRILDLSYNHLTGGLPPALPPNLVELALRGNALSGPILRSSFAGLLYLEVAEMAANRLGGRLEWWFLRLPSLQQVNLANNSLTRLEVRRPTAAGDGDGDSRLVAVDLGFNQIEGFLAVELAGFPELTVLSVRHNRLKGSIPWEYCGAKKGSPFRRLLLDGNFLNGKVPRGFFGGRGSDTSPASGGNVTGSFGDNCLESCPASVPLCLPLQKPAEVCKQVYAASKRRPRHPAAAPVR